MDAAFRKHARTISIKLILSVLFFWLSLFVFVVAVESIFVDEKDKFDKEAFRFFNKLASDEFYNITRFITFFGTTEFLLPSFLALLLYFIFTKQKKYAIELGILGASSTGLLFGLKALFKRERPQFPVFEHVGAYSFPSGHALLSFVFCSFIIYWIWSRKTSPVPKYLLTIFLLVFALSLGISRIILRVHYATDVIAGFCIGLTWLILNFWVQKYAERKKALKAKA
ncbi:MAG TPA: phosphatase PAP2 family protein [Flavisolibacter sp.]|jgi:undecaprenyl-diphosphatase|nr:phosphatase PAP2 family protein [Flavisolibacter sp.]